MKLRLFLPHVILSLLTLKVPCGNETVSTEARIVSSEKQFLSLENAGINAVTLGKNHAFDCFKR